MENIAYFFIAPIEDEPISARFRSVVASCENRKVLLVFGDSTEEVTPEWWISLHDCAIQAKKVNDVYRHDCLLREIFEKFQALRELQKVAALDGRFDLVDYISSVVHSVPGVEK